jgi:stage III sporulation protein AE
MSVNIIKGSLNAVLSTVEISRKFMVGFAPVYTLIISLSGNSASALTYNTFAVIFAEVISVFISTYIVDIVGVFFCLGISFSINENINVNKFTSAVNRTINTIIGLSASAFTGFLSLKNILSVSVDKVSVRSIRFLISSFVPVIGSAISEAYSSLLGSINLIKSSVAIVGILVTVIINTPIITETLIYYLSFNFLSYLSDSLLIPKVGNVFRIFATGIRTLLIICVFQVFIMIITTGIVLSVKSG